MADQPSRQLGSHKGSLGNCSRCNCRVKKSQRGQCEKAAPPGTALGPAQPAVLTAGLRQAALVGGSGEKHIYLWARTPGKQYCPLLSAIRFAGGQRFQPGEVLLLCKNRQINWLESEKGSTF